MTGIGFAGQGFTSNRDNLSQTSRGAGFARQQENYAERGKLPDPALVPPEVLAAYRVQLQKRQRRERRRESLRWIVFGLLSAAALAWFLGVLT
ncbi:MAG: hypothetical protein WA958_07135 [Tunicatimonas sp.]